MQGVKIDEIKLLLSLNGYTLDIHPTKCFEYKRGFVVNEENTQIGRITIINGYYRQVKWYKYSDYAKIDKIINKYIDNHIDKEVDTSILLTKFAQIQPMDGETLNDMFYMPSSLKDRIIDKIKTKLDNIFNYLEK